MNWRNTGILILVLLVPILLILVFKTGTTNLVNLPVYGDKVFVVDSDSVDYTIDLNKLIDNLPEQIANKHFLLYLGEDKTGTLQQEAIENLTLVSRRLENAVNHPRHPVDDIVILSISENGFKKARNSVWLQVKSKKNLSDFVSNQLGFAFEKSENPIEDQMVFLVDKDRRVRSLYFAGHGKFDRDLFGELVVLKNEYELATGKN
mgnify:CR=1 FL=1